MDLASRNEKGAIDTGAEGAGEGGANGDGDRERKL